MSGYHKTSISLDANLARRAQERAARLGFKQSFSAYVAKLIEDDLADRPPLQETTIKDDHEPAHTKPGPADPRKYKLPKRRRPAA